MAAEVNYAQRIAETDRALTYNKCIRVGCVLLVALPLAQIIISSLGLAGYLSVNTLGALNISAISLIIIVPAAGTLVIHVPKELSERQIKSFAYLIMSIILLATFIFSNAYAISGKISLQTLSYLSICSPILIMMAVTPCGAGGIYAVLLEDRDRLERKNAENHLMLEKPQRRTLIRVLILSGTFDPQSHQERDFMRDYPGELENIQRDMREEQKRVRVAQARAEVKAFVISGAADPRSGEHENYLQALAALQADFPQGLESIHKELRKEKLVAAWSVWKTNVNDSDAHGRFEQVSQEVIKADGNEIFKQIIQECEGERA